MEKQKKQYICIDLKSFYASVECAERNLDAIKTNLVVADPTRTEKTICLAVSPALKAYGIPGRARLFEVMQAVKQVNRERQYRAPGGVFHGKSVNAEELAKDPGLELDYIVAMPQMAKYIEVSSMIYRIYLKYVAPEDIHVYSIDEVFMDVTSYLNTYEVDAHELAMRMIHEVMRTTDITATAGIGTNPYLAKVAMDIVAKHMEPDEQGVRIAELDEMRYRELLWNHRALTDFWRVGRGYAKKLESKGMYTMGDVARCSLENEEILYQMFGVNAELLIDHAWGYEPCDMTYIKSYQSKEHSIGSGQVLQSAYPCEKGRLIVKEMTDLLVLDLVDKRLATDQIVLTVGYDIENLSDAKHRKNYHGEVKIDYYGRAIPKHAHGTAAIGEYTSSTKKIMDAMLALYDRIVNPNLLVRRITIAFNHIVPEDEIKEEPVYEQMSLFTDYGMNTKSGAASDAETDLKEEREKERAVQEAILEIQKRFGKNALLKGMNLEEGAMTMERNNQIGGHKA